MNKKSGQAGFTLIEIIAVLVILAVLAAVAIPAYVNLMNDARTSALQGAIAAGQSQCSLSYGSRILQSGGVVPTEAQIAGDGPAGLANSGFPYVFAAGGGVVDIPATDVAGVSLAGVWNMTLRLLTRREGEIYSPLPIFFVCRHRLSGI